MKSLKNSLIFSILFSINISVFAQIENELFIHENAIYKQNSNWVSLGFGYDSLIIPDGYAVGDRLEIASPTPGSDAAIIEVTSLYQEGPSFSNGEQGFGQGNWGPYYPIIYKNAPYSQFQKPLVCYGNDCGDIVCAYGSVGLYIGLDGDYTVVDEAGWEVTLMGLKAGTFCPILVVSVADGPEEYEDSTLVIY